jgi:predicted metalloprotease
MSSFQREIYRSELATEGEITENTVICPYCFDDRSTYFDTPLSFCGDCQKRFKAEQRIKIVYVSSLPDEEE